jgi:hypothetical protein
VLRGRFLVAIAIVGAGRDQEREAGQREAEGEQ